MGALKDVGLDLSGETFYISLVETISNDIENKKTPRIDYLDLSVGFDVQGGGKKESEEWKKNALSENSNFRKTFIDKGFSPIFDLVDSVPATNILKPVGITDPTVAMLPISNIITDLLASLGVTSPNKFFLTNLDELVKRKEDIQSGVDSIVEGNVDKGSNKIAEILNEIDPNLNIEVLKSRISEKSAAIASSVKIQIPEMFNLPDLSDLKSFGMSFFNFDVPDGLDDLNIKYYNDIIFNFDLEMPPIGVVFVELAKTKIKMLAELALGIPPFLAPAIEKIKELFLTGGFTIKKVVKQLVDAVFNTFFDRINQSPKIKKLLERSSSIIYVLNGLIKILVGGLVVSIVGILFGKGLIMKSTAIALGLLK